MRKISLLGAILSALVPAASRAETHVEVKGGLLSIQAKNASIPEVLTELRERTGMRIIYDGAPPQGESVQLAVQDQTPAAAIVALLEHRAIKYAMVLDGSGTRVEVLLITTAPPPPRLPEGPLDGFADASDGGVPVMDEMPVRGHPGLPPAIPEMPPSAPPASSSWVQPTPPPPPASPFTPQGPGPIILPLPGAPTPPPAPTTNAPVANPIQGPSTAEMPPWEKYGPGY